MEEESLSVCLKEGLDLQDLRRSATSNDGPGVLFEVAEEEAPFEGELTVFVFPKESTYCFKY